MNPKRPTARHIIIIKDKKNYNKRKIKKYVDVNSHYTISLSFCRKFADQKVVVHYI